MWKSSLHIDKYQYARTNPYAVRLIGLLGIGCTVVMAMGFMKFIEIRPLYSLLFGPIVFIFVVNKLLRYFLQLFYQKFDIGKHEAFISGFWESRPEPSVAVFLPYAGEDLEVHREVVRAVANLNYGNYKVYMLDDVGSPDHERLATQYGFNYLSRPNKGEHKKSGNLQYGYDHSEGEFVLILDADFIPERNILKDLVPYMATDPEMGILQTPQYFEQTRDVHKRSRIEFGGGNIVEDFYRIVMPCRDEFRAAMCVGTSALYRRTAIDKLDGTPKVHASEDLATGLLVTQFGFYVKYLPLIVSMGKSPDTYDGYFKQHLRWCSGNLVFAKYWPTAHLSLPARLVYIINPMHYLSEASTVLFAFQFLTLLLFHSESLSLIHSIYFLPYVILNKVITPLHKVNKSLIGTKIAALNNSYTYFYTYIRMLIRGVPAWQPTGVKSKTLHPDFIRSFNLGSVISASYIIMFLAILLTKPAIMGNYNTYVVLGWSFYSVFWHAAFLTFVATYVYKFRIQFAESFLEKTAVHLKTYSVLVLFSMLMGTAIFSGVIAFSDPRAPTVLAINELNRSRQATPLPQRHQLALAPTPPSKPAVLAASTTTEPEVVYVFPVDKNDSLTGLAKQAVRVYAREQNVDLEQHEVDTIARTMFISRDSGSIKPGDVVTIKSSTIEHAIMNVNFEDNGPVY